ncbi:MAG: hypothetical protein KC455_03280 [Carnobacterium sp.]|nr:hypothetical protein [Carnobacterium sp.]
MGQIGEVLIKMGNNITEIGLFITPFSFISYLFLSYVQYIWKKIHYTNAVKSIWYLAVGIGEVTGDGRFYLLVVLMIFMDCVDSFVEFLEERREKKEKKR